MMKKILIILVAILIVGIVVHVWLNADYNKNLDTLQSGCGFGYGATPLESVLGNYYIKKGEFPERVIFDAGLDRERDSVYTTQNTAAAMWMFADEFVTKADQPTALKYYPIYNRNNGKRESFVLLSAGIDGKIDNIISDTLFMDTWLHQLRIYNVQEVMASAFNNRSLGNLYIRTRKRGGMLGSKTIDPVSDTKQTYAPRFSLIQYFFGKKDYIVRFGLPYSIYRPFINAEIDTEDFDKVMTWTMNPELIWRDSTILE